MIAPLKRLNVKIIAPLNLKKINYKNDRPFIIRANVKMIAPFNRQVYNSPFREFKNVSPYRTTVDGIAP